MTATEAQKTELKKAHNARFTKGDTEYRIKYEGGIAESFGIYSRPIGGRDFKYVAGFAGYKLYTKEQVISIAKTMVK